MAASRSRSARSPAVFLKAWYLACPRTTPSLASSTLRRDTALESFADSQKSQTRNSLADLVCPGARPSHHSSQLGIVSSFFCEDSTDQPLRESRKKRPPVSQRPLSLPYLIAED